MEGGDASGSAKTVQTAAPWCRALWFGPDAHGEGGAGIPTSVAVLALGRIRLTLLTVYALWRLVTAGMPRRAAAVPADAMVPGDAPHGWSERHGQATFERPGLTRSIPWRPSRLQSAVPLKPVRVGVGGFGPVFAGLGCAVVVAAMDEFNHG